MTNARCFIAFLRAINVGGHTVKMDQLRAIFEALGFTNVATFIASGNVIFESADVDASMLEERIEQQLRRALGYEVATFLRTPAELATIARHRPFRSLRPGTGAGALFVGFLRDRPLPEARKKVLQLRSNTDDFHVHERELYWLRHTRLSESAVSGAMIEKTLGMPTTLRNVNTVNRLVARYASSV